MKSPVWVELVFKMTLFWFYFKKCTFFFPSLVFFAHASEPCPAGKHELSCVHSTDVALQDPWVLKFRFSRRLSLASIRSRRGVKRPPSCSDISEGGLQREMCRNLERCPPSCHHTCEITCQIYLDFKDLLLPASPSLKLFYRGNTWPLRWPYSAH